MAQKSVKTTIGIILFPLFCLLLSFNTLITDTAFTTILLENKDAVQPTVQLLKHFRLDAEMPEVFNETEKQHLTDVRHVISGAYYLLELIAAILIFCSIPDWKAVVRKGTILLIAILLIAAMMPFDKIFTLFHQVVFPQGNWQFPPDSTLITFYPFSFFTNYAIAIAVHALLIAFFLVIVSRKG